jgi:hypothetical protein
MFYVGYIAIVAITSLLLFAGVMFIDKIHHYLKTAFVALLYYTLLLLPFEYVPTVLSLLESSLNMRIHPFSCFSKICFNNYITHPNNTQPNPKKYQKNSTNPCFSSCQIFVKPPSIPSGPDVGPDP